MSGYIWTVTGGTITSGQGTASIAVTWTTSGSQTVTVNYTNSFGCFGGTPGSMTVIVIPLPTPTITGPTNVCANSAGNVYTTEAGNFSYTWSISAGGTITSGGTSTDNTVTVTWNTAGAQTVSVTYLNIFGCAAASPTVLPVTVNPRALPTISGPASVCLNSTGNIYITEAGNSNYIWSVSAGGTITAGGGINNNTVTVTWNTVGAQTVSVSYTNAFGCTTVTPTVYNVTVNALPSPTIAGPAPVCAGSTGNVYTTQAGNTNYIWAVSAGGTITAGGTTNSTSVTVTWNTAGAQTVSVNYTNGNGCTAAAPTVYNVTVNALPTPTIAGPTPVCAGTTGNVYTTQAGNTNYIWSVSAGGTITAGGTTNSSSVTVTWNTAGAQTVSVNYTNGTGCTAAAPTVYNVTVNAVPTPTIIGPASICGVPSAGNNYLTESGMTNYVWSVSAGGTITAGGTATSSFVTVLWTTVGAQTVSVNYTNAGGCTAASPTVYNVSVNPLPVPTISGPTPVCVISTGNVYTTQAGMTNYIWAVSAGGVITAGGTTNSSSVTITWNTVGAQTVSVNYTNSNGCTAAAPTVFNVTANPTPAPTLAGPTPVCAGSTGNVYTTQAGNTNYIWAVSAGGTITAGGTTNSSTVTVTWNTAGAQTVSVDYTNGSGCTASSPTVYNVTVNALPTPTIAGPTPVCAGATGNLYTTQAGMTNYIWAVSAGGTITAGGTTNSNTVTVTWNTAGAQTVSVNYTNSNGCTAAAPTVFNVTVNALPVPTLAGPTPVCAGATGNVYTTQAGNTNYIWAVSAGGTITAGGTTNSNTVTVTWNTAGAQTVSVNYTNGSGCTAVAPTVYNVTVNALPTPTIAGPASVCVNSTGNVYTTQAGNTNYIWAVSAGGTITAGGTTNSSSVTVTWNTAGAQTVSVNYTNSNGCTATSPTVYNVTVNPLPIVTNSPLSQTICSGSTTTLVTLTSNIAGTTFAWTASATPGVSGFLASGTNTIPVQTISTSGTTQGTVTYVITPTSPAGCVGPTTNYTVLVNPTPVISTALLTQDWSSTVLNSNVPPAGWGLDVVLGSNITYYMSQGTWPTVNPYGGDTRLVDFESFSYSSATNRLKMTTPVSTVGLSPITVDFEWYTDNGYAGTNTEGVTVQWSTDGSTWTNSTFFMRYNAVNQWVRESVTLPAGASNQPTLYVAFSFNSNYGDDCHMDIMHIQNPTMNPTVCSGTPFTVTPVNGVNGIVPPGTTYSWPAPTGSGFTGGAAGSGASITGTLTNTTNTVQTATYTVTPIAGTCPGIPFTVVVTLNPVPSITPMATTVCSGTTFTVTPVNVTNGIVPAGTTYTWPAPTGAGFTGGAAGSGASITGTLTNTTNAPVVATYTVTPTAGTCPGAPFTLTVTLNPTPTVTNSPLSQTICSGSSTTLVTLTSNVAGATFTWTATATAGVSGFLASGTNTIPVQTITTTALTQGTVTYAIIPTANGCAGPVTNYTVLVNPLPVVTNSPMSQSVCSGQSTTLVTLTSNLAGTTFTWTATATPGVSGFLASGTNTIPVQTITTTAGTQGTVTYAIIPTSSAGCVGPVANYLILVNPLPTPTIAGPASVCLNSTGNVYTTQPGNTNYVWSVSPGGIVTAGGGSASNTVTVTWVTAGAQFVGVNYTNSNGCTALNATTYVVTVNPLPVPTISGPNPVCVGSTGNVYTTQAGNTNYIWVVSAGGIVTAGGTTNSNTVTVTWNTVGPQTITINYSNIYGCTAVAPTVFNLTVNALPVPTLSGPTPVCIASTGNVYTTQAGMTNYIWSVSAGGTITGGGTTNSNTVIVTWNTAGAQTVSVNYTNPGGCTAAAPVVFNVTVNNIPVPTITGQTSMCVNSGYYNYTTEAGMQNYVWTVSSGGLINYGSGTYQIQVSWIGAGAQTVSVTYSNGAGCNPVAPTVLNVTVNPVPDQAGTITGTSTLCAGTNGVAYSVAPINNATTYVWALPPNASIATGAGTNSITVNFANNATSGNIYVYGNNICGDGGTSPAFPVTVNPLPDPAGTISGPNDVCLGTSGVVYSVATIANATGYVWTVPSGFLIVSGTNTNSITVNITLTAVSGNITVMGTNSCGDGTVSPNFAVTVNPIPPTPVVTNHGDTLISSAPAGNQWYFEGTLIVGATGQRYVATQQGYYWDVVDLQGCSSDTSNHKLIIITGINPHPASVINLYPVPNEGRFNVSFITASEESFTVSVYNNLGVKIYEETKVEVNGSLIKVIDIRPVPNGMYMVIITSDQETVAKRIIVNY